MHRLLELLKQNWQYTATIHYDFAKQMTFIVVEDRNPRLVQIAIMDYDSEDLIIKKIEQAIARLELDDFT